MIQRLVLRLLVVAAVIPSSLALAEEVTEFAERPNVHSALIGLSVGPGTHDIREHLLKPFVSDGCSMSPDGLGPTHSWVECCKYHDIAYWLGGTRAEKEKADNELQQCMTAKGYPKIGKIYADTVKTMGGPNLTVTFRWGYGWNYIRPYSPLTEKELADADEIGQNRDVLTALVKAGKIPVEDVALRDPTLNKISESETAIYNYLRSALPAREVVKNVKVMYFNIAVETYFVQLDSCQKGLVISINKHPTTIASVQDLGSCLIQVNE